MKIPFLVAAAATFACVLGGQAAMAQQYSFKKLDFNKQDQTLLLAINRRGLILAWDLPSSNQPNCLLVSGRSGQPINNPNADGGTYCYDINSGGLVVGYYESNNTAVGYT